MAKKKQKMPLVPKITFVGGKWYNELGKEVPRPQRQQPVAAPVQSPDSLQRYTDDEILERLAGCTCTKPQFTGHVPGCVHFADALYVCEQADRLHISTLAKLGETTISDLERRRIEYAPLDTPFPGPSSRCPDRIPQNDGRRRCWRCPYWERHPDETPFDHQKGGRDVPATD